VNNFTGEALEQGQVVEVRGIASKEGSMAYGDHSVFDKEFGKFWISFIYLDMSSYEAML
jgi:hypothetical protein